MRDKIIRFELNAQNKQIIELQLESKDYQHINWERTKVEITIDLGYIAFSNIEYLNIALFYWLKLGAIDVSIIINNVAEDIASRISNVSFFNSIVNKLEECNLIKYLKITVIQANMFNAADFTGFTRMTNLQILDLSSLNMQQEENNECLIPIVNLLNNIDETSNIARMLLPNNFKQQALNVEYSYENQLFNAIKYALSTSARLVEIRPLPIFLELQDDIQNFINKKQGGHLEELYYEHDRDYETIKQLRSIKNPTSEVANLLASKVYKFNNAFKDIENLCQIIDIMKPKNIYWLDKILRERLVEPSYILSCLRAIRLYDDCQELLFKMLQGLVSDIMAGRFREIDIHSKELTNFICADGDITKCTIVRTFLKIHLEFDVSKDEYLSKILSNLIEEFVYGCGGLKSPQDTTRLAPSDKLDDLVALLISVLNNLQQVYLSNQIHDIWQEAVIQKYEIFSKEQIDLVLFTFNYFRNINSVSSSTQYYSINLQQTPRFDFRNINTLA